MDKHEVHKLLREHKVLIAPEDSRSPQEIAFALGILPVQAALAPEEENSSSTV